jgi:hypothetical protein
VPGQFVENVGHAGIDHAPQGDRQLGVEQDVDGQRGLAVHQAVRADRIVVLHRDLLKSWD